MANMRASGVELPAALPSFSGHSAAQIATSASLSTDAFSTARNVFSSLSAQLQGQADAAAADEGRRAGKVAGLDQNYRPDDVQSVRARAFRDAATSTYGSQVELQARDRANKAYSDWEDLPADQRDPKALQATFDKIGAEFRKDHVFPELQGQFNVAFGGLTQGYMKAADADLEKRTKDAAKATLLQNTASAADTAHRLASLPTPDVDKQIASQFAQYGKLLDAQVQDDTITAAQAEKMKQEFRQSVQRTRVEALFRATPDADKPAFVERFRRAYGGDAAPGQKMTRDNWSLGFYKPADLMAPTGAGQWVDARAAQMADELGKRFFDETGVRVRVNDPHDFNAAGGTEGKRRGTSDPADNPHVGNSRHLAGDAFDFQIQGLSPAQKARFLTLARDIGFKGVGFYNGGNGHLHLDAGADRSWGERPDWAQEAMRTPPAPRGPNPTRLLDPDSYDYLDRKLGAGLRAVASQANAAQRAALSEIDEAAKLVKTGFDLPDAKMNALQQKFASSPDPEIAGAWSQMQATRGLLAGFKGRRPEEIEAQIAGLDAHMAKNGATEPVMALRKAGQAYLDHYRSELASDPLARAVKEGVVAGLTPIDASSAEALAATLRARQPAAEQTAARFGLAAPTWLTPDEKSLFKSIAAEGGERMVKAAAAVAQAMGPRTGALLSEIGGDAPLFAQVARVAAMGGDPGVMRDAAWTIRMNNEPGAKISTAPPAPASRVFKAQYGDALWAMGEFGKAAETLALNAYAARAKRENLDPKLEAENAQTGLARTAQLAVGATFDGSTQYGGVARYRPGWFGGSRAVLSPADVKADRFGDVLGAVQDADLSSLPQPPLGRDKTVLTADQLRHGHLTSLGPGVYAVSLGDPKSADPQWVGTAKGERFVLDLNALAPALRARVSDAYKGR